MKSFLQNDNIEMYSMHNEGKSIVAEKIIRTLKNKIYKYMTLISKNVYIYKLDDIVNKYKSAYNTIKMKPVDVKQRLFSDSNEEINDGDSKFRIGDIVRISKYKTIFAKGYVPNWFEEVFVIKKVKSTLPWTYVISYLKGKEIFGNFYSKELELQKSNEKVFWVKKVMKRKGDEL